MKHRLADPDGFSTGLLLSFPSQTEGEKTCGIKVHRKPKAREHSAASEQVWVAEIVSKIPFPSPIGPYIDQVGGRDFPHLFLAAQHIHLSQISQTPRINSPENATQMGTATSRFGAFPQW